MNNLNLEVNKECQMVHQLELERIFRENNRTGPSLHRLS